MNTPQPNTAEIIAPPPTLYLTSLALALGANAIAPVSISAHAQALRVAGVILLCFSGAFARWAFVAMKRQGTSASPRKQSDALTIEGPFKWSRNPIYVAMTGLYLGIALLANSSWPFLFLVPLLAVMHWGVILREERYLAQRFGEAYMAYKSTTRRWL